MPTLTRRGLPLGLLALEWSAPLFTRRATRLTGMSRDPARAYLQSWLDSRITLRHMLVFVTITNVSDLPNTITRVELERKVRSEGGKTLPLILGSDLDPHISNGDRREAEVMRVPLHMTPREACRRVAAFQIPEHALNATKTDDHWFTLEDTFRNVYSFPVNLVRGYA